MEQKPAEKAEVGHATVITTVNADTITVSWGAVENATGYEVQLGSDYQFHDMIQPHDFADPDKQLQKDKSGNYTYTFMSLKNRTSYVVRVRSRTDRDYRTFQVCPEAYISDGRRPADISS